MVILFLQILRPYFSLGLSPIFVILALILVIGKVLLLVHPHIILVLIYLLLFGSKVIAAFSGTVEYTGFIGAGGFTIIISNDTFSAYYSHLSPTFLCKKGDFVFQGNIIGSVGPKYVYGVSNNNFRDSNGNPTNGATTGPHLHFSIKKDGKAVNPLNYISSSFSSI